LQRQGVFGGKLKRLFGLLALILSLVGGSIIALTLYTPTINFLSFLFGFLGFNWVSGIIIFVIGVLLFGRIMRILGKEFLMLKSADKSVTMFGALKFFVGGIIGSYALFSVMGGIVMIILSLFQVVLSKGWIR
jgi:hypothetical protein